MTSADGLFLGSTHILDVSNRVEFVHVCLNCTFQKRSNGTHQKTVTNVEYLLAISYLYELHVFYYFTLRSEAAPTE